MRRIILFVLMLVCGFAAVAQEPVVEKKPAVVQEAVVEKKTADVAPAPAVEQKEVVAPAPAVEQKEVVAPAPAVEQKEVVAPASAVEQKDVVAPVPVVEQKADVAAEPVAEQQVDVAAEPVVDQKVDVAPEPVIEQKAEIAPAPFVEQQVDAAPRTDKHRVAVYMAGEEPPTAKGSYQILGTELARAITTSDIYSAVDRTDDILDQISKEHMFQRSGAVSDDQIKDLGKQLGVKYLCVAMVNVVKGGYFLEARLVDVETAEVLGVASTGSALQNSREMVSAARRVARGLMTGVVEDEEEEKVSPTKGPFITLNTHAGYHYAAHKGGTNSAGMHVGLGAVGFLRSEHFHKFGVAAGIGYINDKYNGDGYTLSGSGLSANISPTYRAGHKKIYGEAAVSMIVPVFYDLNINVPGLYKEKRESNTDLGFAIDLSGRFKLVGAGVGRSLTSNVTLINAHMYFAMGRSLELVPSVTYYMGDGWNQFAVSLGVSAGFW